jgi:hypothetical protein
MVEFAAVRTIAMIHEGGRTRGTEVTLRTGVSEQKKSDESLVCFILIYGVFFLLTVIVTVLQQSKLFARQKYGAVKHLSNSNNNMHTSIFRLCI